MSSRLIEKKLDDLHNQIEDVNDQIKSMNNVVNLIHTNIEHLKSQLNNINTNSSGSGTKYCYVREEDRFGYGNQDHGGHY